MKKQGLNFSPSAFVEMNKKLSTEVEAGEEAASTHLESFLFKYDQGNFWYSEVGGDSFLK